MRKERVTEDIYIFQSEMYAQVTAGAIVTDEGTIVIDTLPFPRETREMIDFLVNEKHLTRDDAYQLSSVAADLNITQLVDGNKGVHAMIPKAIFVKR